MEFRYSRGAARVCGQSVFRDYVTYKLGRRVDDDVSAARAMRELCGVESRSEFDNCRAARDRYLAMLADLNHWLARGRR